MLKASVVAIILNWNSSSDTVECVKSLLDTKYPALQIVVIDNGSELTDSERLIKVFEAHNAVILMRNKANIGFSAGVNIGIKESLSRKADFTLLLNNDTTVERDYLQKLVDAAHKFPLYSIFGSRIYYYDNPSKIWESGTYINNFFPPLSKKYKGDDPKEVTDVVGCSMLIRNEVFKKIGYFDESYFAYGEETDFNFRARKAGLKLMIVPDSVMFHKVSLSTGGGFNSTVAYYKMRNKIKYAQKNLPAYYWPSYSVFLLLFGLKHATTAIMKNDWRVVRALLRGVRDAA